MISNDGGEIRPLSKKVIQFQYKFEIVKEYRLVGYNSPYKNIHEAELDIKLIIDAFNLKDKLQEGRSLVIADVKYIPDVDNSYEPSFTNLKIEYLKDGELISPDFYELTLWQKIKRWFRRIKVKRG